MDWKKIALRWRKAYWAAIHDSEDERQAIIKKQAQKRKKTAKKSISKKTNTVKKKKTIKKTQKKQFELF
jgi:hypothetical protein